MTSSGGGGLEASSILKGRTGKEMLTPKIFLTETSTSFCEHDLTSAARTSPYTSTTDSQGSFAIYLVGFFLDKRSFPMSSPEGEESPTEADDSGSRKVHRSTIEQFLEEEKEYLHAISVLNDSLLKALLDEGKHKGFTNKQIEAMRPFLINMRHIWITHDTFGAEILKICEEKDTSKLGRSVCELMLKFAHHFRVYLVFHKEFDVQHPIMLQTHNNKTKLTKYVKEVQDRTGVDIMNTLQSMLLRVPQMVISFEHMQQEDFKLQTAQKVIESLSEMQKALISVREGSSKQASQLFEVHSQIKNSPFKHVMQPGRRLITQGKNVLPSGEEQLYVLYNDLLLWTDQDLNYAGHLYLNKSRIKSVVPTKSKNGQLFFKLVPGSAEKHARGSSKTLDAGRTRLRKSSGGSIGGVVPSPVVPVNSDPDEHSGVTGLQYSWMCADREAYDKELRQVQALIHAAAQISNYKRESMIITGFVRNTRGIVSSSGGVGSLNSPGRHSLTSTTLPKSISKMFGSSSSPSKQLSTLTENPSPVRLRKTEHPRLPFSAQNKVLSKYIPHMMLERLVRQDYSARYEVIEEDTSLLAHEVEEQVLKDASVLVADVSGFTKLNERLRIKMGDKGAEQVTKHLNTYFTMLLDVVTAHGGDCIKFAGDALICLFANEALESQRQIDIQEGKLPQVSSESLSPKPADQKAAVPDAAAEVKDQNSVIPTAARDTLRAAQCGLELQAAAGSYEAEGVTLTIHCAVATGTVHAWHLGGYGGEWEFMIAGEPFVQLESGVDLSSQGEVVISKQANLRIGPYVKTLPLKKKGAKQGELLLERVISPLAKQALPPLPVELYHNMLFEDAQRKFLTRTVLDKLDTGQSNWVAELRRATVVFLNLTGLALNKKLRPDTALQVHNVFQALQAIVAQNQGYRRQFLADDKGTVLIVVFGVPPFAHEDDAFRATKLALEMNRLLGELKLDHGIGIASGEVFAGSVGAPYRQEHAVVGDTVNLSARLAGKAAKSGKCGLIIDEKTYNFVKHTIKMTSAGEIQVKGKDLMIAVFSPAKHTNISELFQKRVRRIEDSIERKKEMTMLTEKLAAIQQAKSDGSRSGHICHLIGPAGIGKTQLLHDFQATMTMEVFLLTADPTKSTLALGRDFLENISGIRTQTESGALGLRSRKQDSEVKKRTKILLKFVSDVLGDDKDARLPLFNLIMSTDIPETEKSQSYVGDAAVAELTGLVLHIFRSLLHNVKKARKLVLLIDDAHLLDEDSFSLLSELVELVDTAPFLLVISSRPTEPSDQNKLGWHALLEKIQKCKAYTAQTIEPLSEEETKQLLCQYFRVKELPGEVLTLVHSRAKGNPLFAEEVSAAIERTQMTTVVNGVLVLDAEQVKAADKLLPASLTSLVTRRIDSLELDHQLLAKLASVFQDEFDAIAFSKLYEREQLLQHKDNESKGTVKKDWITRHDAKRRIENQMSDGLAKLQSIGILSTRSHSHRIKGLITNRQLYFFVQPEVMHACYKMLLYSQRSRLHYQIVDILEKLDPDNEDLIKFHVERALETGGKEKNQAEGLSKEEQDKLIQKASKFKSTKMVNRYLIERQTEARADT
eukprot:gb/GEZN01000300.1/.p1 GENE.gb/GEZN01000300.1/~~gb/GEZN01000300.1/.p1  ORF type:complete len:1587 (-),score=273.58 gb/GEZN01000300.1/:127-4887(-)